MDSGEVSARIRRWADPALTVLAIELANRDLHRRAPRRRRPRDGYTLPALITALVVTPVLMAALLVVSVNGVVGAVFVAIAS